MSVYDSAQDYRRRLAERDAQAAAEILAYYQAAWLEIQRRLRALQARMAAAREQGTRTSPSWLFRQDAYQQLLHQVALEIEQFARLSAQATGAAQLEAIAMAIEAARDLAEQQLRLIPGIATGWVDLNPSAVEQLAGALASGPLADLFAPFSRRAQEAAKSSLIVAVSLGDNPRTLERKLSEALGITRARALTISRTEILRAHREATRLSYQANPHMVERWQWLSAMDNRVCPACWAMTGSVHEVDEPLGSHPNCRCTMVPIPPTWVGLFGPDTPSGLEDSALPIPDGELAFAQLPEAEQITILGPIAYREYAAGRITLADLVAVAHSDEWGTTRTTRSLRSIGITV